MKGARAVLYCILFCIAVVHASPRLFPLAGCWEVVRNQPGQCRQKWGYQLMSSDSMEFPLGANNQLLFNGRQTNAICPPTLFTASTSGRSTFETITPCDGSLVWLLNNHSAHARIGHSSHHCTDKEKPFSEHPIADFFPPITSAHCTQMSLSLADNGNCVRLDHEVRGSIVHTQILDMSISTLQRTCTPGSPVDVTLAWSLRRACDQADTTAETFATITVECETRDLHFGIDGRVQQRWTSGRSATASGMAMSPEKGADQGGRALMRALDRMLDSTDDLSLIYLSVVAHASGMETRIQGGLVRMCYDPEQQRSDVGTRFATQPVGVLEPFSECTTRLDEMHGGNARGDVCRSWFGYRLTGTTRAQHRPISELNTFLATPADRGQPVYFQPGEHHYVYSVAWNCSDFGEPNGPMLTWKLDSTATANRRGPLCRVGCDGVQGSDRQYDRCGVCGGTGLTCGHVIRGPGQFREYCDGDHEQKIHCQFDAATGVPTDAHLSVSTAAAAIVSTDKPPLAALGMPNAEFGGPGVGIGGARAATGRNSRSAPGALVLPEGEHCLRVQFDRPVHLHSATVLNIQPFCDAPGSPSQVSVGCVLSSDCGSADQVCESGHCVARLGNTDSEETLSAQQHAIMSGYAERGYEMDHDHTRCENATECQDEHACTIDVCVCGFCMHRLNKWCCERDDQCPRSFEPCDEPFCDLEINRCDTRPREDCCSLNQPCTPSSSPCTETLCVDNHCRQEAVANPNGICCEEVQDCPQRDCRQVECVENLCDYTVEPGCCITAADCDDTSADDCVDTSCVDGRCMVERATDCCTNASDCLPADNSDPCLLATCTEVGRCQVDRIPGCCRDIQDCPAAGFPCVESNCTDNTCYYLAIEGCCRSNNACNDSNPCTSDTCVNNECVWTDIGEDCCSCDQHCDDGDDCTRDTCVNNICVNEAISLCCVNSTQCPISTFPCAEYICDAELQRCVFEPVGHFCCTADPQCEVLSTECVFGACNLVDNECSFDSILGCCQQDVDCGVPSNPCLAGTCDLTNGSCVVTQLDCDDQDPCTDDVCQAGECIHVAKQCADDGNACTISECVAGVCVSSVALDVPGCCNATELGNCAEATACTETFCVQNNCVSSPVAGGCCTETADCELIIGDVPPCAQRACNNNQCVVVPDPTCCFADAECPQPNGTTCTIALCINGTCVPAADPTCCNVARDCRVFPAETCLDLIGCLDGICEYESRLPCCNVSLDCAYLLDPLDNASCYGAVCNATSGLCELIDTCPPCDYCNITADCLPQTLCTVAECVDSVCHYSELDCDDGINCTVDGCAGGVCVYDLTDCVCEYRLDPPLELELIGVFHDFNSSHPDFEGTIATETGIVADTLGVDGLPVYAGPPGGTLTVSGNASFWQWYRDVPGVNLRIELPLILTRTLLLPNGVGRYTFADSTFFPLDGLGFGNEGRPHNYHFTLMASTFFVYEPGAMLTFTGDDDMWVFVNHKLVVDLGGVHPPLSQTVGFGSLGLFPGVIYPISFFFAERHTVLSNFNISTDLAFCKPPPSATPSVSVSFSPTAEPTPSSTISPTPGPTTSPSATPTVSTSFSPTAEPTLSSTISPSAEPTPGSTASPSATLSASFSPTAEPTFSSTVSITSTLSTSFSPTAEPTPSSTTSITSTLSTSFSPTAEPTFSPTISPTPEPSTSLSATPEPSVSSSLTPSATVTPSQASASKTNKPGWGNGDDNHNHTGPPGQEGKTTGRRLLSFEEDAQPPQRRRVMRSPPTPAQLSLPPSPQRRSWIAVYTNANSTVALRREQIPAAAANNGLVTVEMAAEGVSVLELCSCSGHGGLIAVDYLYTGSSAIYDRCGVCGGDGSSCHYAPIDSVRIQTRMGTDPLTARVLVDDDNDVYELCYYHGRQKWDSQDYSNQAVRIGFEPHRPCASLASGSCDSMAALSSDADGWCMAFVNGPEETIAPDWRFERLGNTTVPELDCRGDALFTCPVGDGSAGYRVCRNISLSQLLTCRLRDGRTEALSTTLMSDHTVQYTGTIHATELVPVECDNPALCERVMHHASRRLRVRSSSGTGRMIVDFDSDNLVFEAHVSGVTCSAQDDSVRVHFSTTVRSPWGNSVYLDTPVIDDYTGVGVVGSEATAVITAMGIEDPVENARLVNPCTERSGLPICTQLWTARLASGHQELRLVAAAHVDDTLLTQSPLVIQLSATVPCDSIDLSLTGVRSNEAHLADSGLVLYHDAARTRAYVFDLSNSETNTFTDGTRIYGRINTALPSLESDGNDYELGLDDLHICYPYPGSTMAGYLPYDPLHPLATGCMSPGEWLVTTLYRRGALTNDGSDLDARFAVVDTTTIDFDFIAKTATTATAIYVDARWHVNWRQAADARKFATDRLSQHRAAALAAGRSADDFAEPLTGFHSVLTPQQMHATRHLPSTQRRRLRSLMLIHTAARTGLSADGLRAIYNGTVQVESSAMTREYGAYNDEVWYSSGYGYYQTQCEDGEEADNQWATPLTKTACTKCQHCDNDDDDYQFPCVWPCWGACWPYHCDDHDDHDHFWWLWLIPLGLFLLFLALIPLSDPRPPRNYTVVQRRTTAMVLATR